MKILLVSMNSIHFTRWTNQLENSGHEVHWFNIHGTGFSHKIPWVDQIVDWKLKYPNLKGRHQIKKRLPKVYNSLIPFLEKDTAKEFEKALLRIQPDVVHSFVLYMSCVPIYKVMLAHKHIPWIYSSWGSDLYFFRNQKDYLKDIKTVLPRINYLITDCKRDVGIAHELGFNGEVLGTFPGGGGFHFSEYDKFIKPFEERDVILIKGYQGRSGRCVQVLRALKTLKEELDNYKIVVFGADEEVVSFVNSNIDILPNQVEVLPKSNFLPHHEVLNLMGTSKIYIGNSNSDGMPNTLLEAIIMGAFPIQSNPGGATEEVIEHKKNGLLIQNCEDVEEISRLIKFALNNENLLIASHNYNLTKIKPKFEYSLIQEKVLNAYNSITLAKRT